MRRGEIWIADVPPPTGRRPVLFIMRDDLYEARDQVMVAGLTTRARGSRFEVAVGPEDGLPRSSVVNTSNIFLVSKNYLVEHISTLSDARMREVERAIHFVLEMNCDL